MASGAVLDEVMACLVGGGGRIRTELRGSALTALASTPQTSLHSASQPQFPHPHAHRQGLCIAIGAESGWSYADPHL